MILVLIRRSVRAYSFSDTPSLSLSAVHGSLASDKYIRVTSCQKYTVQIAEIISVKGAFGHEHDKVRAWHSDKH